MVVKNKKKQRTKSRFRLFLLKHHKPILLISSTFLGIFLLEILVRVLDVHPKPLDPLPIPSYQLSQDPTISYEYRPNYTPDSEPYDNSHLGYQINGAGFRDYDYREEKPKDVYRIIVLGDSTTAGNSISNIENTYTKQLEKKLNATSSTKIRYEVLNMGVGGYHTMQEVQTLKVKGLKYKPDLVLLTFCVNDYDMRADGGVYWALKRANPLINENHWSSLYNLLVRYSRLAFIIHYKWIFPKISHDELRGNYEEWYSKNVLKGESTVKAGLTLLSELQLNGFAAYVAILPAFSDSFAKYGFASIHERVLNDAKQFSGIKVFDLTSYFAKYDEDGKKFSADAVHLNEYGHKVMAEILLSLFKEFNTPKKTQ